MAVRTHAVPDGSFVTFYDAGRVANIGMRPANGSRELRDDGHLPWVHRVQDQGDHSEEEWKRVPRNPYV